MNITLTSTEISEILTSLVKIGADSALTPKLDQILASLKLLQTESTKTMAAIDDLTAAVAAQTSVDASAVTLIQGIAAQLQTLSSTSPQIAALAAQLTAATAPLAAAVAANTPAAPAPAPAPAAPATPVAGA